MGYGLAGLTLLAALVLLAFQMGTTSNETRGTPQATAATAQAPAPQSSASAVQPQPAAALPVTPIEDLQTLWPQLPGDINAAWRALAPDWKLPANSADPCQTANAQQLQCYRASRLTMPLLRQLNRPGILTLQTAKGPAGYALLVGLSDQTATLRLSGRLHTVRLIELAQLWRGDFATYWQVPAGYTAGLKQGSTGPAIDWLASRLTQLDGLTSATTDTTPLTLDNALHTRVRAFQRARGITPDGQPGPMTFMQLESATQGQFTRLLTDPR